MNILVSAGPTREYFDSVRFISNPSSGKMGYALAGQAARRGHQVTLVTGPVAIEAPTGVKVVRVETAAEMAAACKKAFRKADAAFMTAAVCDYRPRSRVDYKRAKKNTPLKVVLEPTQDIAAALGRRKGHRILVAFAMEDHDPYLHAERKLRRKNCDLIVLNGPANVGRDHAEVELFSPETGWTGPFHGTKERLARRLIRLVERLQADRVPASR
ncbi:MAG: phosphopantothenoylcysteine decarboxylase domain-containing protein [Phycisphaerae bacterium]